MADGVFRESRRKSVLVVIEKPPAYASTPGGTFSLASCLRVLCVSVVKPFLVSYV
jgi:hypothetical protein